MRYAKKSTKKRRVSKGAKGAPAGARPPSPPNAEAREAEYGAVLNPARIRSRVMQALAIRDALLYVDGFTVPVAPEELRRVARETFDDLRSFLGAS